MPTLPPVSSLRPLERLLAREIDLTQLPAADDMDELVVRIEALEHQVQFTQQSMNARINALTRELAQSRAQIAALAPLATLGSVTPALAHDLNTALGNSGLAADVMRDQLDAFRARMDTAPVRRGDLNRLLESFNEGLNIVHSAGACAGDLVGSLKTVAIDGASGRTRRFALRSLVDDVLVTLRPALRQARVHAEVDIDPALLLESAPGLLAQVVLNLVQNAVVHAFADEAMPDAASGKRRIDLTARMRDVQHVVLEVSDNGMGMSTEVLARAFTPYFTTRAGAGGSGVGLSHARSVVEAQLNGTLTVDSTPGVGTRFCVTLPLTAID